MNLPVILKFMDGESAEATLCHPLRDDDGLEVILTGSGLPFLYSFYDICCLLELDDQGPDPEMDAELIETVETVTGETYLIHPGKGTAPRAGFYGYPPDPEAPFRRVLFTHHGVRQRRQERPLGEILAAQGALAPQQVDQALQEQEGVHRRRLGEVLTDQGLVEPDTLPQFLHDDADPHPQEVQVDDLLPDLLPDLSPADPQAFDLEAADPGALDLAPKDDAPGPSGEEPVDASPLDAAPSLPEFDELPPLEEPPALPELEELPRFDAFPDPAAPPLPSSAPLPPGERPFGSRTRGEETAGVGKGSIPPRARIGEILVAAGLVTTAQVEDALANQKQGKKKRIGERLIDAGLITEDQLLKALATKFGLSLVNLDEVEPTPEALSALPRSLVSQLQVLPLEVNKKHLVVATSRPTDPTIGDALRFSTDRTVELVVARSAQIAESITRHYAQSEEQIEALIEEMDEDEVIAIEEDEDLAGSNYTESDSQIIRLVNKMLLDAHQKGASDIHIEPSPGREPLRVRYRIDGVCHIAHQVSASFRSAVIARLKIMSRLDIAEHRRPQSGKIIIRADGRKLEFRLEVTPTVGGQEDAVLRLLATSKPLSLDQMEFTPANLTAVEKILAKPYGIVLCVGPTGSGKTTSLHSALGHINTPDRKIWTAEDPVEITQAGLRQVQVNAKIGFTFKEALRSFLRADPDVIMIGEMRDPETAQTAIEASLTGHLVFSTLHTNSAPETVVRLIEMGMDPFNFAEALLGVLAQRLARRLCNACKRPYHPTEEEFGELVQAYGETFYQKHRMPAWSKDLTLMQRVGCDACNGTGYRGRIAIHELLYGSDPIKDAIKDKGRFDQLRAIAIDAGMRTLRMDAVAKILAGKTDLEQVLRVCV